MPKINNKKQQEYVAKINTVIDPLEKELYKYHDDLIETAELVGYYIELVKEIKNNLLAIASSADNDVYYSGFLNDSIATISSISGSLLPIGTEISKTNEDIKGVASVFRTTCDTSASIVIVSAPGYAPYNPPTPTFFLNEEQQVLLSLEKLNPALSKTYQEIDQIRYGTNADQIRGALAMLRQSFDMLFSLLAPDDEVIASRFWGKQIDKDGKEIVTRFERINFAIDKHINDQKTADTLINSAKTVLQMYDVLNKLHSRKLIMRESVVKALDATKDYIRSFIKGL